MSNEQLFIAPKIKVGFQKRSDTYTEKLAYVIYYDLKGVLRKERSWESWRDEKIDPVEFENVPTEGFVLNKKVGGVGYSHWNHRQEYVRVYDPRNFEFEITVTNLLFILRECDCSRGKGLEGKFVYAWSGTTLVLLPVTSAEYQKSAGYTDLQIKTISTKELVNGASYMTKKQEKWIYLDRRLKHNVASGWGSGPPVEKVYVFCDDKGDFIFQKNTQKLAAVISDTAVSNYAELVEKYDKSIYGSAPVRLFTKEQPARKAHPDYHWYQHEWAMESSPGVFRQYSTRYDYHGAPEYTHRTYEVKLQDVDTSSHKGIKYVKAEYMSATAYPPNGKYHYREANSLPWVTPVDFGLWVELASGSQFKLRGASLITTGDKNG